MDMIITTILAGLFSFLAGFNGRCGTCLTKLLSGNAHMEREEALNDELRSQRHILPCVSRFLSDITRDA